MWALTQSISVTAVTSAFYRESFLLYTVIFVLFYSKEDKLNIAFQRISVVFSLNF